MLVFSGEFKKNQKFNIMMNIFKKKQTIKMDETKPLQQAFVMPSLLEKIILEYKDDLDSSMWKVDVYANGQNIGYLCRGNTYGFWFESKLGEAIHEETIDKLKISIKEELERYRIFFKQ